MNKPIRTLSIFVGILFMALLLNVTHLMYWQAPGLSSLSEHPDNRRVRDDQFSRERGAILVRGRAIAESVPSDDEYKFQRVYPQGPMYAHITGFFSRDYGLTGIEASQDAVLAGSDSRMFYNRVTDLFGDSEPKGGNITLTINPRAQRAAYDGLRALGRNIKGAVVALEPATGKVLALVSSPTYNPNRLATHDFASVGDARANLGDGADSPLQNRAIEEILPPGSTYKVVTAASALAEGGFNADSRVPGTPTLDLPQTSTDLTNLNGASCGGDRVTMTQALQVSCNVSFGWLGLELGPEKLRETSRSFGFEQRYFTDLDDSLTRQAISEFQQGDTAPDEPQTAFSAIGQSNVRATPMQMAMVAAGVANNGVVRKPYLVDEVQGPDLAVLDKTEPEDLGTAMSPGDAAQLRDMMTAVVDTGTGTPAQIPGIAVAGKTGTAQSAPDRPPYAWFISFAPSDNPQVAVAVLVQDAGVARDQISGGGLAAPIAKAVMEAVVQ